MKRHTHFVRHNKKKWFDYFFDFLMLFLAITAGFYVENLREHRADKKKEHQYILSIIEDLKMDTTSLSLKIKSNNEVVMIIDSLIVEFTKQEIILNSNRAFLLWQKTTGFSDFVSNDRTIQQLKSSGSMRLITNQAVSDSIINYDKKVEVNKIDQEMLNNLLANTIEYNFSSFANMRILMNPGLPTSLLNKDRAFIEEIYGFKQMNKNFLMIIINSHLRLKNAAARLIAFIQKEYKIE